MSLKFSKWTGLGNDFVLVEPGESFDMTPGKALEQRVIELCDRRFGIGADGVVVVTPINKNVKSNEFKMHLQRRRFRSRHVRKRHALCCEVYPKSRS